MKGQSVTKQDQSVTPKRDTSSRAHTPLRGKGNSVTVSRCHGNRDVTVEKRDSDKSAFRLPRHHHAATKGSGKGSGWLQIAALNLIDDFNSGLDVDPTKLAMARQLLGRGALL